MKKKLLGAKALLRLSASFPNALVLTLVGILVSGGHLGFLALAVFIANWLTPAFACAINDVEDAEDDMMEPKKAKRNPICNGMLTKKEGYIISLSYGFIAAIIYVIIGIWVKNIEVVLFGVGGVIVSFLYSWKPVRLKSIPIIDLFAHGYMLSTAQFLVANLAFNPTFSPIGIILVVASYLISIHGDLENENRDFEVDKKAKINNTAQLIGNYKVSRIVQYIIMALFIGTILFVLLNTTIDLNLIWIGFGLAIIIFITLIILKQLKIYKESFMGLISAAAQLAVLITIAIYIIFK